MQEFSIFSAFFSHMSLFAVDNADYSMLTVPILLWSKLQRLKCYLPLFCLNFLKLNLVNL